MRKPKSHYRETKVRRLIIVTATADPSSSRRKREMEDAKQRGYAAADEKEDDEQEERTRRDEGSDERQRTVVVKGPCGTKSHALCPAVLAIPVDLLRFLSSNDARFFRHSTRFICAYVIRRCMHAYRVERVKFVITFITKESCIFQDSPVDRINR